MAKKTTNTGVLAAEVGAGLAAAAAAAGAGYYFYASDKAKKHRKDAAKWAGSFKNDVVKEAKRVGKNVDARTIANAVDKAISTYQGVSSINRSDLNRAAAELKRNWKLVQREALAQGKGAASRGKAAAKRVSSSAKKSAKKVVSRGRKAAKKAVKKVAKKVSKKAGRKTRR